MAKNLVNGSNIKVIESGNNISLDFTSGNSLEVAITQNTNDIEEIKSNIGKSIKVTKSTIQTLPSETNTIISFDTTEYNNTTNLSLSNNKIIIGSGVNTVLVNASWTSFDVSDATDNLYIYIYKNDERESFKSSRGAYTQDSTIILPVEEGDTINVGAYQSYSTDISISEMETGTYLQVVILN